MITFWNLISVREFVFTKIDDGKRLKNEIIRYHLLILSYQNLLLLLLLTVGVGIETKKNSSLFWQQQHLK
jgi:hypothetical protein